MKQETGDNFHALKDKSPIYRYH